MTEANYSSNDYYHYGYDAVGNRETQTTLIGGLPSTTNYFYDEANRIETVNGVPYVYDNNGNLKNDGVNAYEYDSANRLISFSGQGNHVTYAYNGLNDRLQETVNGSTTAFTMDLNAGLTQALTDGTNTYIYGVGRIAQINTSTEYFLGDALESVRQLSNATGAITYAKAYDPYGVVTSTVGSSQSTYGYTSEYTSQGLVYLRARMYVPGIGRFLTRDTWGGDYQYPLTLNGWSYTSSNPINYLDPSGHYAKDCHWILGNYLTGHNTRYPGDVRDYDDCWTKMPDGQYVRNPWCQVYVFEGEHQILRIPKVKSPLMPVRLPSGILILMASNADDEEHSDDDEGDEEDTFPFVGTPGQPGKGKRGIYEFMHQFEKKPYVGSAYDEDLVDRLRGRVKDGTIKSWDDVYTTEINVKIDGRQSPRAIQIAERIRIEQVSNIVGGRENMANAVNRNPASEESVINWFKNGWNKLPGWPSWLKNPWE